MEFNIVEEEQKRRAEMHKKLDEAIERGNVVYSDRGPEVAYDKEGNIIAMFRHESLIANAPAETSKLNQFLANVTVTIVSVALWVIAVAAAIGIINWILIY
jgi:hypothetical protein